MSVRGPSKRWRRPHTPLATAASGLMGDDEQQPRQMVGGLGGIGPAWTRGEIEKPAGERNMGTWTAAVYTEEQQVRLGVDEHGTKVHATGDAPASGCGDGGFGSGGPRPLGGLGGIGPAWTRGEMEKPAGEKDMGGWTALVYTEEQQARLGVDEQGIPRGPGATTSG